MVLREFLDWHWIGMLYWVTKDKVMSVVFPLSEPYMSHIHEFVGCKCHLSLWVTDITPNIFLTLSMNLCGSLPTCDAKNLGGFIITKSQNLAATNQSFLLVGTRTCWLFLLVILWAKSWIGILKLCIWTSFSGTRGTVLALSALVFHA